MSKDKSKVAEPAGKANTKQVTRAEVIEETKTTGKKVEAIGNAMAKSDDKSKAATGKQLVKAGQTLVKAAQKAEANAPVKIVSSKKATVAKASGKKLVQVQVKKTTASKPNAKRDLNDEREGKVKPAKIKPTKAHKTEAALQSATKAQPKRNVAAEAFKKKAAEPVIRSRRSLSEKARSVAAD